MDSWKLPCEIWSVFSVIDWQPGSSACCCSKQTDGTSVYSMQCQKKKSTFFLWYFADLLPLHTNSPPPTHPLFFFSFLPQTLMIRDWWMCMIISVMFEFLEYSLEHQLPNFSECWWDHVCTNISPPLLCFLRINRCVPRKKNITF